MARNRKRAKERRDRRPQTVGGRSRVAAAPGASEGSPSPIEHATPDVELADAQLAVGRPDVVSDSGLGPEEGLLADENGLEAAAAVSADEYEVASGAMPPTGPPSDGGEVAVPAPGGVPEPRPRPRARLAAFLEGSWRELQRVQWPDRRQVMQATAVVIGFVIVAGVVLGVADTLASHLMDYILTNAQSALAWVAIAVIVVSAAGWMLTDRDR